MVVLADSRRGEDAPRVRGEAGLAGRSLLHPLILELDERCSTDADCH
jgi:hypothetical protein